MVNQESLNQALQQRLNYDYNVAERDKNLIDRKLEEDSLKFMHKKGAEKEKAEIDNRISNFYYDANVISNYKESLVDPFCRNDNDLDKYKFMKVKDEQYHTDVYVIRGVNSQGKNVFGAYYFNDGELTKVNPEFAMERYKVVSDYMKHNIRPLGDNFNQELDVNGHQILSSESNNHNKTYNYDTLDNISAQVEMQKQQSVGLEK